MSSETLTGLLKKGQNILAKAGIGEAGLDAWLLLEYVTGKSRAYYFAYGEESVTESAAERYLMQGYCSHTTIPRGVLA